LEKPNPRFNYEQATQATKSLMSKMPQWLQLPFIRSWVFWAIITLGISGGLVYLALGLLLNPRAVPNCPEIFVPMSSASLRVYCGQLAASKQTLPDLVAALNLIKDIAPDDPTRSYVDSNIQKWSVAILRLAEVSYQEGRYDEAVSAVKNVPNNVPAYKPVAKRLIQWQETWEKGQAIYKEARELLTSSKWVNAYSVAVELTHLNNRYWAQTKYQELAEMVQTAKADSAKLDEAHGLVKNNSSDLADLLKAIDMASKIENKSFAYTEAQAIIATAAKQMLAIARVELDRNNWQTALEIAKKIPEAPEIKIELQDTIGLCEAQSHAKVGTVSDLETAISLVQSIKPSSPISPRAQKLLGAWQLEIQDLTALQKSRSFATIGTVKDLELAIIEAQRIPSSNPRGKEAAQSIAQWRKQIEVVQDTPFFSAADNLANGGAPNGINRAIAQLTQVRAGRALYPQAQQKILKWTADLERAQDGPIMERAESFANSGNLRNAVEMAGRIRSGRAMYAQAQVKVRDWESQLQATDNLSAARRLANSNNPESLLGAIAAAARVPRSSPLRDEARSLMNEWGDRILDIARRAAISDIPRAISIAQTIPSNTSAYGSARSEIQGWRQQIAPKAAPKTEPNNPADTNTIENKSEEKTPPRRKRRRNSRRTNPEENTPAPTNSDDNNSDENSPENNNGLPN
jgi:tetratricopeptide (TPR) repeat protein